MKIESEAKPRDSDQEFQELLVECKQLKDENDRLKNDFLTFVKKSITSNVSNIDDFDVLLKIASAIDKILERQ